MIIALHGAVGMAEDWADFPEFHALNLWPLLSQGPISLEEAGQRIAAQAHDGDTLVAYSMGGRLALHTLAHRSWKKVILISTHPGLSAEHEKRLLQDEQWAVRAEKDWSQFLHHWNEQTILSPVNWGDRAKLMTYQKEIATSFRCWSLGQQRLFHVEELPTNITYVVGEHDQKFRRLNPKQAVVIPQAGHRVPWEAPENFRGLITSLLSDF